MPPPTYVQEGNLPLHIAAMQQHRSVVVVNLLLDAYQDGAKEKNAVCAVVTPLTSLQIEKRSCLASIIRI